MIKDFLAIAGDEAAIYSQFVRTYGTRDRINDIIAPTYHPVGEIQLPRNSVFHYQPGLPGERGPSNSAAFISNYDRRINMYFWDGFDVILGNTKSVLFQANKEIKQYEAGHFNYIRTRNYQTVVTKDAELLVNNMAMCQIPVVYTRKTVFSGFQEEYNKLYNVITAVNQFAQNDVHQFVEFKLSNRFPSWKKLEDSFNRYKKFFKDGEIVRYDKEPLKPFQADRTFWLMDLFAILIGFEYAPYSQFNRLTEKARSQLEMVFTYEGRCWIVNLQTLINLLNYKVDMSLEVAPAQKLKYFKRFYLALVSLVTPLTAAIVKEEESEEVVEENEGAPAQIVDGKTVPVSKDKQDKTGSDPTVSKTDPDPVAPTAAPSLADLYAKSTQPVAGDMVPAQPGADVTVTNDGSETDGELTPDEVWESEIDDQVFEQVSVDNASIKLGETKRGPTATIERMLEERVRAGLISTKELEYYQRVGNAYKDIEFGGRSLEEVVDIKPKDLVMKPKPIAPDSDTIQDKSVLQSRTTDLVRGYNEQFLQRDIIGSILGVQNGGIALADLEAEPVITADSKYMVYTMKFQPILEGGQSTRRFRIPIVEEDDTFTINGVKSYSQLVRMEVPVRKIGKRKVSLTSYYDKKIMIERSPYANTDYARWLKNSIIERSYIDKSLTIQLGGFKANQKEVCWYYSVLGERFKEITKGDMTFNFDTAALLVDHPKWKKYCSEDQWLVGIYNNEPVVIDQTGTVSVDGIDRGYIEEILGLNIAKAPVPDSTIYINGYKFPSVVVLSYWMGFSNLLERLKPTYRTVEPGTRPNLSANEYMVQFADERLIFDRRDGLATLVFSGLRKLPELANFSRSQLDDPNVWFSIVRDNRVKPTHFKEMSLMFDMFIDHITARELERRGYPVVMDELVVRALEMLLNNEAEHEVEVTEQRFVGYERFAGHIYREMVRSNRQFRNKPGGNKKTFDLNPESVMMAILTDSSHQSVEEVSPVHQIKQQEEVTFGGAFGRSDMAMVRRTRGQLPNYAGIISEAGKDSGKVGFISYLTSDAKIVDYAGNVDVDLKPTNAGKLSVTGNLMYGTTRDDPKRTLFAGVQISQWMATNSYSVNPMRTPYDTMIAYRTSELYSSVTKQIGEVTEVTPYGITVVYENGLEDTFPLGYEVGKGAGEYHKHNKVTDVKVGDKFDAGKVIAWDATFFTRDTLDPNRVNIRLGTMTRIALIEDQFTFEDSVGITKSYADYNSTPYLKLNDFKIDYTQSVKMFIKVGDTVSYDQVLCEIQDEGSAMFDDERDINMIGLDRLGIKQIKAYQPGKVTKIEVVYNGDLDDASASVKAFITSADSTRAKSAKYKKLTATSGNVGGNTSVGKSKVYPGTAVVYIYIENNIVTTVADKFVAGNQMKGTVGYIYEHQIYTADGRKVDMTFSLKSLLNRMVLSLRDKLVGNEVNAVYTQRMIDKYPRYE